MTDRARSVGYRPRVREQLSYLGREFAPDFAWNMAAGDPLFYYADVADRPVAALGTLILVSRIPDAVGEGRVSLRHVHCARAPLLARLDSYGALQPTMVRDPAIKVRLGGWRAMSTSLASMPVYSLGPGMTGDSLD